MSYIDVRVSFDEYEDEDFDVKYFTPREVNFIGSDLEDRYVKTIGESAHQSDTYTVGVVNAFLNALGDPSGDSYIPLD